MTLFELYQEYEMMRAIDPRPINGGKRADGFIRYLIHGGYLPADMSEAELEHLANKFASYIREAVYEDRKDRFLNSDKQ